MVASILGAFTVRAGSSLDSRALSRALHRGTNVAMAITVVAVVVLGYVFFDGLEGIDSWWGLSVSVIGGLIVGFAIGKVAEIWTSSHFPPVKLIARQSETGPATTVLAGVSAGMQSVAASVLLVAAGIGIAYWGGEQLAEGFGIYGIALAAIGMLATTGVVVSVDAYGPIADNAGGIAEMAHLDPKVREVTDSLDALGNTTAAIAKGFAVGSAALTALALFKAFEASLAKEGTNLSINVGQVEVFIGLIIGAMLPFLFAALTIDAVGRAANKMIEEVRRQFREIPGLREGREDAVPEYAKCVDISTGAALREMLVPGALALAVPLTIGFIDVDALGGFLAGALVTGFCLAIFMANAGGAWDNAKKYIEGGEHGGKGSDAHKAAVVGDTVGDPFKDTSGPSMNILIKVMTIVALIFAPAFVGPPGSGLGDEVDQALDGADELRAQVRVAAHPVAQPRPEADEIGAQGSAHPFLPRHPSGHGGPLPQPEPVGADARPDVDEGMSGDEHVRIANLRREARLLRAVDEVVEQHAQATLGRGAEGRNGGDEVVGAVQRLDHDAEVAQVVAPHVLDELGVVAALHPDAAGPRRARPTGRAGDRATGGGAQPGRRCARCGPHERHGSALEEEPGLLPAEVAQPPVTVAQGHRLGRGLHDVAAEPRGPVFHHQAHLGRHARRARSPVDVVEDVTAVGHGHLSAARYRPHDSATHQLDQAPERGVVTHSDQHLPRADHRGRVRVRGERPVRRTQREHQRARALAQVGVAQAGAGDHRPLAHLHLLQAELHAALVHHDVDELGHVRSDDERGHARATQLLGVHDPVGTSALELADAVVTAGPSHDEQLGAQLSCRQRHEQVLRVAREGGHERFGPHDPRSPEHLVMRRVPGDARQVAVGEPADVAVDDDHLEPGLAEVLGDHPAHPTPAAHDHVPVHVGDVLVHAPPPHDLAQLSADHDLHHQGERVEDEGGADEDQPHREHLLARPELLDLPEPDRGDRGDGLVGRVEQREPERHVAGRACQEHEQQTAERDPHPAPRAHHGR
jgi:hypothetical protein